MPSCYPVPYTQPVHPVLEYTKATGLQPILLALGGEDRYNTHIYASHTCSTHMCNTHTCIIHTCATHTRASHTHMQYTHVQRTCASHTHDMQHTHLICNTHLQNALEEDVNDTNMYTTHTHTHILESSVI
jgi:hypothetical protein